MKSGGFRPDTNGVLTDANDKQLLGFLTDSVGDIMSGGQSAQDLRPVELPNGTSTRPTTRADLTVTLPPGANVGDSFQAPLTVVDSLDLSSC